MFALCHWLHLFHFIQNQVSLSLEQSLINRVIADGDPLSFTLLVKMHQSAVRNFLRRMVSGDVALAEDLSQNTFLKAFKNIHSYSAKGSFISWLLQIAYREYVDELRKNGMHSNTISLDDSEFKITCADNDDVNTLSLQRVLNQLNATDQIILNLNYSVGLTHEEITNVLDIPIGTVKTKIRRAKQKLKSLLTPETETI